MPASASECPVNTARVQGRRTLQFERLPDILAEAERLSRASRVTPLGNWTLGQALGHLARAMDMSIDGSKIRPHWFIRLIGPWLKNHVVYKRMAPGFKLPGPVAGELVPDASLSASDGLAALRKGLERLSTETQRMPHSVFGRLTHEEWERLHLRHAELHLGFFLPQDERQSS